MEHEGSVVASHAMVEGVFYIVCSGSLTGDDGEHVPDTGQWALFEILHVLAVLQ